jgi:hypothetical protein
MKKIILIVEDLPEEQEKAKEIVLKAGCTPLLAEDLSSGIRLMKSFSDVLFGVITDIHYQSMPSSKVDAEKPNGLALVALCVEKGTRVAVCSDIDHHFSKYLDIPLRVLGSHQNYGFEKIPVSRSSKNWEVTLEELLNLKK